MEYIALNDICDVRDGTHDSPKYVQEGFPLVTSKNVVDGKLDLSTVNYITQEDYDKINERSKVDEGDIIMPMIGTIGNPLLIEDSCEFAIKNVALIKFSNKKICNKYIWYFLKSGAFKKYVDEKNKGGTQKFLSLGDIRGMKVPILEYSEQISVVEKFDAVCKVISERNEELQLLDNLIKARFVEMFGNPDINEKKWNEYKMEQLCEVGSSKRIYQNDQSLTGIPFLRISDLVNRMDTGSKGCDLFIPEELFGKLKKQGLVPVRGDILLTARGTLGRCYIIQDEDEFYFQDGMITWLSKYDERITPLYISYLFEMPGFRKQIDSLQAGSTVAYLSISMTKKLNVMTPPIELQNQFADFVRAVDKSKFGKLSTLL